MSVRVWDVPNAVAVALDVVAWGLIHAGTGYLAHRLPVRWLGDRWWALDGRYNVPRIGRIATGRGRDAADVAMITTYGDVTLTEMNVWADEAAEAVPSG